MSNDICVWKSNNYFKKEDASSIFGELIEGDKKPHQIDASDQIAKFAQNLSDRYPPPSSDNPLSVWSSSFNVTDWYFTVSLSYNAEAYVDIFMEVQFLCVEMGLTVYDSGSGEVFPT